MIQVVEKLGRQSRGKLDPERNKDYVEGSTRNTNYGTDLQ